MNKLIFTLVLMVYALFSGAFASDFTGIVSVSEPSQLIVDIGSGESMFTLANKQSILIKGKVALNTQARSDAALLARNMQYAEGTGGYISGVYAKVATLFFGGLKPLTG